jgi:hypothetical protein
MAPRSVEMKRAHAVAAAWAPTRRRARKIAAAHLAHKPHHVPRVPASTSHNDTAAQKGERSGWCDLTPSSRMLPSVIGSIGWSKRAIHRHPLSSQGPEQIIAPPGDEPSNPMQQRKARVGNLAIQVRAVDGQQHYRCHGYQKPPHPRFLGRDARWSRSPTASPGQRSLAVPSGASSARRRVPRAWSRWGL